MRKMEEGFDSMMSERSYSFRSGVSWSKGAV